MDLNTATCPAPHSLPLKELLDAYESALRAGQGGVARQIRHFIDGRTAQIGSWSQGSSIIREALHGRTGGSSYELVAPCRAARVTGIPHDMHVWYGNEHAGHEAVYNLCFGAR